MSSLLKLRLKEAERLRGEKKGTFSWRTGSTSEGDISKAVAKAAHKQGLLPSDEIVSISAKEADNLAWWGSALWGASSKFHALLARKVLRWSPQKKVLRTSKTTSWTSSAPKRKVSVSYKIMRRKLLAD